MAAKATRATRATKGDEDREDDENDKRDKDGEGDKGDMDDATGALLDDLRARGLLENTIVVLPYFARPAHDNWSATCFGENNLVTLNLEPQVCEVFFGAHGSSTCPDSRRGSSRSRVRRRFWICSSRVRAWRSIAPATS
jgi:hypothetical protein